MSQAICLGFDPWDTYLGGGYCITDYHHSIHSDRSDDHLSEHDRAAERDEEARVGGTRSLNTIMEIIDPRPVHDDGHDIRSRLMYPSGLRTDGLWRGDW